MSFALSLIAGAFDPVSQLYCSVVPSLNVNKVRVQSIGGKPSFNAELSLEKGQTVESLCWISNLDYLLSTNASRSKRKRLSGPNQPLEHVPGKIENSAIAIGTNRGDVLIYSISQASITVRLSGQHSGPITSISTDISDSLWSCDYNGTVVEWDLASQSVKRIVSLNEPEIRIVKPLSQALLLASSSIFVVDSTAAGSCDAIKSYPCFTSPVHTILSCNSDLDIFVASSQSERNININSLSQGITTGILIAQSEVKSLYINDDDSLLAAVTEDGIVELFPNFLDSIKKTSSKPKTRKSSGSTAITSSLKIRIVRPPSGNVKKSGNTPSSKSTVRINSVTVAQDQVIVSWLESASVPIFEHIKWKDQAGQIRNGTIEVTKTRTTGLLADNDNLDRIDPAAAVGYLEAQSYVSSGNNVEDLESNGVIRGETEEEGEEEEQEEQEETLAERLQSLKVSKAGNGKAGYGANGSVLHTNGKLDMSTPGSFAVILNQALKSKDHALLETCLSNRDENAIKVSIQRLDPDRAVDLLERLADKISRKASRAAQLNLWIKWVLVTHGGYLVSLPNLLKTLSSLHATLSARVSTLPRLLALQGRLDMLSAQMELRRTIMADSRRGVDDNAEDLEDPDVEYVEDEDVLIINGEEDDEDMEDDEENENDEEDEEEDDEDEDNDDEDDDQSEAEDAQGESDLEVDGFDEPSEEEAPTKRSSRSKR